MLLSIGCLLETDAVEYWLLCWRRIQLSTGCCVEHDSTAGRRAGGRRAARDFNRTPNDSLLQRDAVEHWVLRWRRMPLSTGCCAQADAVEHWALRRARNRGGRAAGGRAAAVGGRVGILIELLRVLSCSGTLLSTGCRAGHGCC